MKLVQIFPEVCQQPQKWSLIENSWEAVGVQPLRFSMPQSCLILWMEPSPRTLPRPRRPQLRTRGDSASFQTPAQRWKPVKPERGFGQDCRLVFLSGLGVNHCLQSLQDELTNAKFSGQGCGLPAGQVMMDAIVL